MNVRYTANALANIDEILSYVSRDNPKVAASILARVEQVAAHIADFPRAAYETDALGVRVIPLGRFPYLLFYTVERNEVVILHVRHAARQRPEA